MPFCRAVLLGFLTIVPLAVILVGLNHVPFNHPDLGRCYGWPFTFKTVDTRDQYLPSLNTHIEYSELWLNIFINTLMVLVSFLAVSMAFARLGYKSSSRDEDGAIHQTP